MIRYNDSLFSSTLSLNNFILLLKTNSICWPSTSILFCVNPCFVRSYFSLFLPMSCEIPHPASPSQDTVLIIKPVLITPSFRMIFTLFSTKFSLAIPFHNNLTLPWTSIINSNFISVINYIYWKSILSTEGDTRTYKNISQISNNF